MAIKNKNHTANTPVNRYIINMDWSFTQLNSDIQTYALATEHLPV